MCCEKTKLSASSLDNFEGEMFISSLRSTRQDIYPLNSVRMLHLLHSARQVKSVDIAWGVQAERSNEGYKQAPRCIEII
jgi:hypothetical protein